MHFPSIFVSHGAPSLLLEPEQPAHQFLQELGADLGRPTAIVVISAHWEAATPTLTTAPRLETIHDFSGFDPALYAWRYAPRGAVAVSAWAHALLETAGFHPQVDPSRGIDHGAWVPLALMYPAADVPVAQLSVQSQHGPAHHQSLGQALRPLREEGVLILASGSLTHNLRAAFRWTPGEPTPPTVSAFSAWVADTLTGDQPGSLLDYEAQAPDAYWNHPTPEHFLPLFVAWGAGTPGVRPRRVHTSVTWGALAMDAYVFA
ncbi:MAG: dioxygenase [Candidatus Competibacteraceae bacterium]|nr:dioxygenase [Candidatus Competibacteraceae bacterium]HRY15657.1 class III extradiol ring-cleavage dioxygenase [Candidatus Competibacteraceae bacterium]